ncbi:MAG: BA14K family protein [Mesorhizobium sp.]
MNKIISGLMAATLSVSFAAAAAVPVNAAPIPLPMAPAASPEMSGLQLVENRNGDLQGGNFQWRKRGGNSRDWNRGRNYDRGAYWNGHRGYRDYRPGYRRHGDNWFPLAAFAAGALVTGAIINNNQNRVYQGNSHVQWCYDQYRSYRASDNTFQPYNGPRQQCRSPY